MNASILIADDEYGIREALTLLLEGEGYCVKAVKNGEEAVRAASAEPYDLIISDIRMPVMSGLQMVEEIKKLPAAPEIIVMTAHGTIETAIQALKNGARDFLIKPFSNETLKATVTRVLQVRELSEEVKKLQELERMKKEFITMIAHELRTPLTAIKGYVKLVLSGMVGAVPSQQEEYLQVVEENSEKLQEIISRMIDMGQLETSEFALNSTPANALNVIWEAISELQEAYEKKQLHLEVNLATTLKPILVDPLRFKQIMTFVLDNAIAFSLPNRRIWLTVDRWQSEKAEARRDIPMSYVDFTDLEPMEYLEISVKDEGPGIPKEKLSQIFEKFYQIEDIYIRQVSGMGIGLSLCKKIVNVMGGKIWVESKLGAGCKFTILLPWREPEEPCLNLEENSEQFVKLLQTCAA